MQDNSTKRAADAAAAAKTVYQGDHEPSAPIVGFQRAVPVLLFALGVFIGLCFITGSTGSFGVLTSSVLLGIFSWAAYFLPFLLMLHAVFYFSDIRRGRRLSRLIFSIVTVVTVASLIHAFTYFNQDPAFSIVEFYRNGQTCVGGGVIGGIMAYLITMAFGSVGLIVITLTVFALYFTFFLARERSTLVKIGYGIVGGFLTVASAIERGIKALVAIPKKVKSKKEERSKQERFENLFEDDYILTDGGKLADMQIPQLGIDEQHGELQDTTDTSPLADAFRTASAPQDEPAPTFSEPLKRKRTRTEDPMRNPFEDERTAPERPTHEASVRRSATSENADDVFGGDFASFDLAMNLRLADKASSRTVKARSSGVREYADSLEEEIAQLEKRKRQEEFEKKKQESISYMQKTAPQSAPYTDRTPPMESVKDSTAPFVATPSPEVANVPRYSTFTAPTYEVPKAQPTYEAPATPTYEAPKVQPVYEAPAAPTYEAPKAQPAYEAPAAPTYEEPKAQPVYEAPAAPTYEAPKAQPVYEAPAAPTYEAPKVQPVYEEPTTEPVKEEPAYEAPVVRESAPPRKESMVFTFSGTQDTQPMREEPVVESSFSAHMSMMTEMPVRTEEEPTPTAQPLVLERTMLDPTPRFDEPSAVADEEEDELPIGDELPEDEVADNGEDAEIPPELRNPNIEKERQYFSLFREEPSEPEDDEDDEDMLPAIPNAPQASNYPLGDEDADEDEDDDFDPADMPPFEMPSAVLRRTEVKATPKEEPSATQSTFVEPDYSDYQYPPIDLLTKNTEDLDEHMEEENRENADKLHNTLESFGVTATVRGYDRGPRITRFEIVPAQGTRVNKVTSLFDDITLALAAKGIRMEAPIPGKRAIGVEIPNKKAQTVRIRDLIEDDEFSRFSSKTIACIGKDVTGNPVYGDIAKMPHLLVAGATGMGKSVSVNSMLISILFRAKPDEVKLIIFDPKKVDFQGFNGIPHLLVPVVTEAKQAAGALMWAVDEMEKRFTIIEKTHVKKIDDYNAKVKADPSLGKPMPKIIIVIDELNDLMLQVKNPVETLIMRIAQKARAAGIHLIVGTQRPSVNVLTGVIKANIPSRMSCKVASNVDSRTVLEVSGAEKLLNNGDMLYFPVGSEAPMRVQGAFVSDEEMEAVMDYLRTQAKGEIYDPAILDDMNRATARCSKNGDDGDDGDGSDGGESDGILSDPKFLEAADIALSSGKISTALLQRRCSIGYGRAAKYIDYMEDLGLVSEPNGQKPRDVLLSKEEWNDMLDRRSLT